MAAEKSARDFVKQGVAGVICQPIEFLKDSEQITRRILSVFDEASVPVVLCDYDFTGFPKRSAYDVVGIDNVKAGALVYEHVKSVGAKRIGFLVRPYASQSQLDRLNGAIIANKTARDGVNCEILIPLFAHPEDSKQISRYVRRNKPDAIICGNDKTAAILKGTLETLGVDIPRQLVLAGFDDVSIATIMSPRLTTIHQPCDKLAEVAFYRLLDRIRNPDMCPEVISLPVTLVVRESTSRRRQKGG